MIKVTIFNEYFHEREREDVRSIYPLGMHSTIKDFLEKDGDVQARCFTLDNVDEITDEVLEDTDVIIWWRHMPGHETFPTFYDKNVQTVIKNAVRWARPVARKVLECPHVTKPVD